MTRRTFSRWIAAGLLLAGAAAQSHAQEDAFCEPCCDFDTQWFAPVNFDYDCLPMRDDCGWFFKYDKLSWSFSGERTTVGAPGLVVQSEIIYPDGPNNEGIAPQPYAIQNGIQNAPPDADFGFGDRYEFGYQNKGHGWEVGVIDGPRVTTGVIYGFQELVIPNTLPLVGQAEDLFFTQLNPLNWEPDLPPVLTGFGGSGDLSTSRNGFGSVHVNFETPPDYLLGFRNYWVNTENNGPGPVVGGPGRRVTITAVDVVEIGGRVSAIRISGAELNTGAQPDDETADDLDGDGATFFVILADINGDGQIDDDEVVGNGVDYDDLHNFNIRFDTLHVRNSIEATGVEIMKTAVLDNSHYMAKNQNNYLEIGGGVRFFRLDDNFYWEGRGDVLGRSYVDTTAENQIVGPQIRAKWNHRRGRWNVGIDGRFTFGYNVGDLDQIGAIGEDLSPGALNRPIMAQPTAFAYGRQESTFSPLAELRAEASFQITNAIAAKLGYTAMFVDNVTRASQIVRYSLPDMGILEGGQQDIFINGVNLGFEATY